MKVLFVGPYFFPGAFDAVSCKLIAYVFRDLYEAIESRCEMIYMLTLAYIPEQLGEELKKFPKLQVVQATRHESIFDSGIVYHFRLIWGGLRLVSKEGIDVVTNLTGEINYGMDLSLIGRLTDARSVLRVPGDTIMTGTRIGRYRRWRKPILWLDKIRRRIAYRWADSVIVMTPAERERAMLFRGGKDNVHVCPRGIDTERFPVTTRAAAGREVLKVYFVGRRSEEKGFDIAMDTARLLKDRSDIHFNFVGGFEEKVSGNMTFRGPVHVSDMQEIYNDADVVMMPSRNEGLPQVLLEAMSAGKAIIASRSVFERIVPNDVVVLCGNDPESYARVILDLNGNPEHIDELGRRARDYVVRNYSRERFQEIYRSIVLPV